MKKISILEITVIIFAVVTLIIFSLPRILQANDKQVLAKVKTSNAIFTSKIIEEFAKNKNAIPSEIAQKVVEELNKTEKNPYKKGDFYVLGKDIEACSNIEYDDNLKMVILTTLDKDGTLVARIVIQPPSFVTYYKENNKENKN